ncbi:cupredoxin family copper-binding protein [Candidatus Daviesbacteria bacterium]|nr:cupredoxin family copper-binding protein [Candidatus Daviesbacteria bacterium]
MEGVPETCVKADLGVLETADTPALKGKTKDGSKEGRLYLCSGANSKKDNLDLVWRIDTGDGQLQETDKGTPDPNNLLNKNHVKKAEEILGTTTSGTSTNTNTNTVSVNISNSKYSPSEVTINSGDTVTWTNKDSIAHTVTANNGNFDSRNIGPGESFSYKFTSSGSFSYFCKIHPDMKGVVTVK